ncbi:hypothetical protein [Methylobacterium fujisawaense]|uniref:hypothetical protein n=1 Tax=Methylobacterium fujisawaense TaxID=107400 RepID=UPI0036F6713E
MASDYGLLDDKTLAPKPSYWGALLWRRLMGTTVLDAGVPAREGLHVYAHCLRGKSGGVAMLAINNSRTRFSMLTLPAKAERYTLTAPDLDGAGVSLNGREVRLGDGDVLPDLQGQPTSAGSIDLAPTSITFLGIAEAGNEACR